MTITEKRKTIDNKFEQNKAQNKLKPLLTFLFYHQEMSVNMNFDWQRCITREDLLVKAATMKRFEYWLLGKELKAQADIAKKTKSRIRQSFYF